MTSLDTGWTDGASTFFPQYGDVFTPSRREQTDMIAGLVPVKSDEEFVAVDLGCGGGGLTAALLERYSNCRVIALDGSQAMLSAASRRLIPYADRVDFQLFDLRREDWLVTLPDRVRSFVSSLAIHHLDTAEKQRLFRSLRDRLHPDGALLIADIVEPVTREAWRAYAQAWKALVREQAAVSGPADANQRFTDMKWNYFEEPDVDFDKPSNLYDQLRWLTDAGFSRVDCFWLRAGHAIYGGYV